MAHLLACRLLDEACTADDLATVTERAKACARKCDKNCVKDTKEEEHKNIGENTETQRKTSLIIITSTDMNCGIRHVTVPIATRILIANVRHIGLSNICVINLVYFKMQV